jgi:hypothetical protein
MVHLLLPFLFCKREHRQKLVQYIENITLAQALGEPLRSPRGGYVVQNCASYCGSCVCAWIVYPLLQYEPSVLAVTAIVCGAKLISGSWDEELNRGLIGELQSAPRGPQLYCIVTIVTHGSQISRA